jgi:hypothetical protein
MMRVVWGCYVSTLECTNGGRMCLYAFICGGVVSLSEVPLPRISDYARNY